MPGQSPGTAVCGKLKIEEAGDITTGFRRDLAGFRDTFIVAATGLACRIRRFRTPYLTEN